MKNNLLQYLSVQYICKPQVNFTLQSNNPGTQFNNHTIKWGSITELPTIHTGIHTIPYTNKSLNFKSKIDQPNYG